MNKYGIKGIKIGDFIEIEFNSELFDDPWFPKKIIEQVEESISNGLIFTLSQDIFNQNKVILCKGTQLKLHSHVELYKSVKVVSNKRQLLINVNKDYN